MQRKVLLKALLHLRDKFSDIRIFSPKYSSFLLDEIEWIKACDIPDLNAYQEIDRIGRAIEGENTPQKLTKTQERERLFINLWSFMISS